MKTIATVKIRFLKDWNGYEPGQVIDTEPGIADAFVNYALAAEYVKDDPDTKAVDTSPRDKMLRSTDVRRKGDR